MKKRTWNAWFFTAGCFLAILFNSFTATAAANIDEATAAILAVGPEGKGNAKAARAWQDLSGADADAIPAILDSMGGANPLAANWLRTAVDAIADRAVASNGALPLAKLGEFLLDTGHDSGARRLAFDLIERSDPAMAEALVPGMLNDPSVDLRRDAVQRLIDEAGALEEKNEEVAAALLYRQALGAARDIDQIEAITKPLRALGREVDLPAHFGFLMHWSVIGPFDNTERKGFAAVFPPEEAIDLEARYEGKGGEKIAWQDFVSTDEYGMVDINKPLGLLKETTAFAFTEFNSDSSRPVELRLGCKNAWKVWVNGELLFARDEYHRGMRIDQYKIPAQLNEGKNTILVKLCQDAQTQTWTVEWQFQLRVCDATGTAVHAVDRPPTPVAAPQEKSRRKQS